MIDQHEATVPSTARTEIPATSPRTPAQASTILLEEIRVLRERGLSDDCIHGLLSGFHLDAHPEPTGDYRKLALNEQLIRLIWGKSVPMHAHAD